MNSLSEVIIIGIIGFLIGIILMVNSMDNYARINTNKADGQVYFIYKNTQYVGQVISNNIAAKE